MASVSAVSRKHQKKRTPKSHRRRQRKQPVIEMKELSIMVPAVVPIVESTQKVAQIDHFSNDSDHSLSNHSGKIVMAMGLAGIAGLVSYKLRKEKVEAIPPPSFYKKHKKALSVAGAMIPFSLMAGIYAYSKKNTVKEMVSFEEYTQAIASPQLTLIDFYAIWCQPCKRIKPILHQLASKYTSVTFYQVDVDKGKDVADHCKVLSMPTFQFYKSGKKLDEIKGADPIQLENLLQKL